MKNSIKAFIVLIIVSAIASGWGGQKIIIIPDLEAVIVFTGGNYYTVEKIPCNSIVEDYIIPALTE